VEITNVELIMLEEVFVNQVDVTHGDNVFYINNILNLKVLDKGCA
jgi:hypothetical protein